MHTKQYLHYSSHHRTSCNESGVFCLFNRAYSIIPNNDDLIKENARVKQNEFQESIVSKIFERIMNNHSLSQSQHRAQSTDSQEEEIKISIHLPYI